jgi:hypothetical protein
MTAGASFSFLQSVCFRLFSIKVGMPNILTQNSIWSNIENKYYACLFISIRKIKERKVIYCFISGLVTY